MQNHNTYPYFDDSSDAIAKGYHKILFVPGNPVQARELTQIQSILQEQVKRHGDHMFKNGTKITGGELYYDNNVVSLTVSPSYNSYQVETFADALIGRTLVGQTSGVEAHVIHYEAATRTEPAILFVKYITANGNNTVFNPSEILSNSDLNVEVQIQSSDTSVGKGAIVTINDGIFYINGYFVGVKKQILTLSKTTNTPSNVVGLQFNETIVTSSGDDALFDNAIGFPNYAAPGAHRYKITLSLVKKTVDYAEVDGQEAISFVSLLKVVNGAIQYMYNDTKYAEIEKMLARRTFDESGDYVVKDIGVSATDYRRDYRGAWASSTPYLKGDIVLSNSKFYVAKNTGYSGATAPSQAYGEATDGGIYWLQVAAPVYNDGFDVANQPTLQAHIDNEAKYAIHTTSGKAYISGYEVTIQDARVTVGDKARDHVTINNQQIYAPSGTYALVKNVTGMVDTSTMLKVSLRNPSNAVIGSAWATTIEHVSGTVGTVDAVYKLYLFDIVMAAGKDFADDVANVISETGTTFSADFDLSSQVLSGVVSVAVGSAVVTGKATLFTQELSVGDQIEIGGVAKTVLSIQSDVKLTASSTYAAAQDNVSLILKFISLHGSERYIQPLPQSAVRTMRKDDGTIDTEYDVQKTIAFTPTGASHTITWTVTGETFEPAGHIVIDTVTGAHVNATFSLDVTAKNLTIAGLSTLNAHKIIAVMKRVGTAAREKTKTLKTKTILVTDVDIKDDASGASITSAYNFNSHNISLTECDVQRIIKVTMSGADGAYNATGETDVTSWFSFSSNQKTSHYGISYFYKKNAGTQITRQLKVTFEYFEHSQGDYFSVDSYSSIPYERIPEVRLNDGNVYRLADCLDFRSRIDDAGVSFSGAGGNVSTPIFSGSTISTTYSYYLPRMDVLSLSKNGTFEYTKGVSKLNPVAPKVGDGSLVIANIFLRPYTFTSKDIIVTPTKNRRYTMADIGKMDDRLANVEYYVALNELERATAQTKVFDGNGLERFKNGFIADNFTTGEVGDFSSDEVKAVINPDKKEMRPTFSTQAIDLVEGDGVTNTSRKSDGYQITGSWITLPYTEYPLVSQMIATRDEFINPFAVFSWNGVLKITPERDDWVEVNNRRNVTTVQGTTTVQNVSQTNTVWGYYWYGWRYRWGYWNGQGYGRYGSDGWNYSAIYGTWTSSSSKTTTTSVSQTVTSSSTWEQSTVDIPWMRSVPIACELIGMRPFTNLYAFMDKTAVNDRVTSAYQVVVTGEIGKFLGYADYTASNSSTMNRNIQTEDVYAGFWHSNILAKGELVSMNLGGNPAVIVTAVVMSREVQINPTTKASETVLHVVLPRRFSGTWNGTYIGEGGMTTGVTITGLASGATATVSRIDAPTANVIRTNGNGNWFGYIMPRNFEYMSGDHNISIMDNVNGDPTAASTQVTVPFSSRGKYTINTENVTNRIDTFVTNTTVNTVNVNYAWECSVDPLAQTFTIPMEKREGVFATSVDIFFSVKDVADTQPVRLEIVEAVNGYPSMNVVKNGVSVVQHNQIVSSKDASVATNFKFSGPVYLAPDKEYCVKLLTNSVKYKIWIAQMGEKWIQDPTKSVGAQPHLGVLFKSQNNSTWSAEQMQDMMFRVNCAKFDTSSSGLIKLRNRHTGTSLERLQPNPFGITNGSTLVKVFQENHGLAAGMYVEFSGSTYTAANGRFAVTSVVNDDEYIITIAAAAASTQRTGGDAVKATKNIKYDTLTLEIGQDFSIRTGTGMNSTVKMTGLSGKDSVTTTVQMLDALDNTASKFIHCDLNENLLLSGASSLEANLNIYSSIEDLSPVINRDALRAVVVSNRINNPAKANNIAVLDDVSLISAQASVTFTATTNVIGIPTTVDINKFQIGAYISISGTTNNNTTLGNEAKILNIDTTVSPYAVYVDKTLVTESPASTTIVQHIGYVDEIAPAGGTAAAKYQTRKITLETPATAIKLMFAASIPTTCEIDAYYRAGLTSSGKTLESTVWTKVPLTYAKKTEFVDNEYTINAIPSFNMAQVKFVLRSTDSANVPKLKDLRVLCLA